MSEITHQEEGGDLEETNTSAPNPRDAIMERMAEAADRNRQAEAEGLASVHAMHEDDDEPAARPDLPTSLQTDPMADYIVMQNGVAMMRTKVDGQERLVPLDKVRATMQKDEAAELRLQRAATWQKELAAREQQIAERERLLAQRAQQTVQPPAPRVADADDQSVLKDAQSVVSNLFDGNEKEAAEKLAKILKAARAPAQPQTPAVDFGDLTEKAVAEAERRLQQKAYKKDLESGYAKFKTDFPELMADPLLFAAVDRATEIVEEEHPDWAPSAIMQEAGARVRDWSKPKGAPTPPPNSAQDRLNAKRNLVPMPQLREGSPQKPEPEREQTPAEAFAEIRRQRGQPG